MGSLFGNSRWSDVEIHVWDAGLKMRAQCHAHRAILATFSGTFRDALLAKSDVSRSSFTALLTLVSGVSMFDE